MAISALKKLHKISFNSLDKVGVDWRSLLKTNKSLEQEYFNYIKEKSCWTMVSIDYSQLEIFVLASLSKDKTLIEAVNSGLDIHNFNTRAVYGIDYEEIKRGLTKAKLEGNEQDIVHYTMLWDDFYNKRRFVKALSFSLSYGASAFKIARDLRLTLPEAEKLINDFYSTYPGLQAWQGATLLKAIKTGYLETPFNRHRATPGLLNRHDAYNAFIKEDKKTISNLRRSGEYWSLRDDFKTVLNTNVQSTASDMCSLASIKVNKAFKKSTLRAKLYFWVHDSIVFHCHIDDVVESIKLVANIMENQVKYDGDPVNYRVEAEIGYTYEYVAKLERKDIMSDKFTKELVLEKLESSLDDDIKKKFNLIVKSTSTVMNDLPSYIAAMKEAKGDYFDQLVSNLELGVSTPAEYMSLMNGVSLEEYENSMGFQELDEEENDEGD